MSSVSVPSDADGRRRFVADPATLADLNLRLADLADPDMRSLLISREHPEFEQALQEGRTEVEVNGGQVNLRLHVAMHEIVATQLWDDDPPEVWETAVRLLKAGYDRHEVLHMLAAPVSSHLWRTLREDHPYNLEDHRAALQALPGSWERQRNTRGLTPQHSDAHKYARRAARRRNRRPR